MTIATHNLVLVRDNCGTGGWSLHTQAQIDDAAAHDDVPDYVLSGAADYVDATDDAYGHWSRPNQADYDAAAAKAGVC
jgi:hypothetical protein